MQIMWMGWFKDLNDEYNWLFFTCIDSYEVARVKFFEAYKEEFAFDEDDKLPEDNLIDVYAVREVGGYNIKLEAKNGTQN